MQLLSEPVETAANAGSLSPETVAPLKTELAAKSTTYLNLSMLSWGTNTASPGGLSHYWLAAYLAVALGYNSARCQLGHAYLKLNSRAIVSNIAFHPERQDSPVEVLWLRFPL